MFGINFFPIMARPFNTHYSCFSVSMLPGSERKELESGGKIIMPPSALDHLTRLNIDYPMLFKLTNAAKNRTTHCGVLEFVADEGRIYIPYWMMQNLMVEEGGIIAIESATLPVATFSKFQPHSIDFLNLTNPKAVLENRLRNFACLSTGDVVSIQYNDKTFDMTVLETKPGLAVSIIECDMNVEFAAPVGYQEPESPLKKGTNNSKVGNDSIDMSDDENDHDVPMDISDMLPENKGFVAFGGGGKRLDGRTRNTAPLMAEKVVGEYVRGIPDFDFRVKDLALNFIRMRRRKDDSTSEISENSADNQSFIPFEGSGKSLRQDHQQSLSGLG